MTKFKCDEGSDKIVLLKRTEQDTKWHVGDKVIFTRNKYKRKVTVVYIDNPIVDGLPYRVEDEEGINIFVGEAELSPIPVEKQDKKYKFQVGDIVRYTGNAYQYIKGHIGKILAIEEHYNGNNYLVGFLGVDGLYGGNRNFIVPRTYNDHCWWCGNWENSIEKAVTDIHIFCSDKTVFAKDIDTGQEAKATCSPEDTFDFYIGAQIALLRLLKGVK